MKATIVSTTAVVEISDPQGRRCLARAWEGVTENGAHFVAYITNVQVHKAEQHGEFERDLMDNKLPSPDAQRAIDLRFVL